MTLLETRAGRFAARNWAALALLLLVIVFSFTGQSFLSVTNIQNILHLNVTMFLLAAAETFVIVAGGLDLSVGMAMGLVSCSTAWVMQQLGAAGSSTVEIVTLGCAAGLAIGLLPGLVSGWIITAFRVPPFIATLGMWGICNGLALLISQGFPMSGLPDALPVLGNSYLLYIDPGKALTFFQKPAYIADSQIRDVLRLIPMSLFLIGAVLLVLGFVLRRRKFGRYTLAIGGNVDAAVRSGIPVNRHLVRVYVLSSFLAGIAGVFNVFQTGIGNYTTFGASYELFAIAAVVVGGASLMGGKGRVLGSVIGVLVLAVLDNGLSLSGVAPFYRYIAVGVLLVIAVVIDRLFPDAFEDKS